MDQQKKFSVELWLCSLSVISSAIEDHQQLVLRGVSVRHKELLPLRTLIRDGVLTRDLDRILSFLLEVLGCLWSRLEYPTCRSPRHIRISVSVFVYLYFDI